MTNPNIFTVKIGGQAGQGIKAAGLMLAKVATRAGFYIYNHIEYPSLIRGGHNVMQVNISQEPIGAPRQTSNFLIALNQESINLHFDKLAPGSGILYDSDDKLDLSKVSRETILFPVPLAKLAQESGGDELCINTVALGVLIGLLNGRLSTLKNLTDEEFTNKGPQVIKINQQAAEVGYKYTLKNFADKIKKVLTPDKPTPPKMIVTGNEAVALGAIAAGVQFAAIYPMSPISNILHVLAANQEKFGFIFKQPEDEIAAINMAIGASFAGARSMVATSGGGFCLMTEGLGLSGMTETPLVIIEGMRGGPATGLATWSEQGDLRFTLHAHQGEFPRIVLAPGDAQEAFYLTMKAFNLADKYQMPVIVLLDKNLCENDQSFEVFDYSHYQINRGKFTWEKIPQYQRYQISSDGISLRTIPGSGNFLIANSDEHDEVGYSTEEIEERNTQMQKRMQKLEACAKNDLPAPQLFGPEDANLTIVSWGSNKGNILAALKHFENVNFLHLTWLSPFPSEAVKKILSKSHSIIDVECNYSGQLTGLVREKTGIEVSDKLLKYDGRPIYPEEIVEKIKGAL